MAIKQNADKTTIQFRIPAELGKWLREKAEENTRTSNGELIARLKESRQREEKEANHAP